MKYADLEKMYSNYFSLGYLNAANDKMSSFERKLELISLICYVTHKNKLKNPDVTHYNIVMKVSQGLDLPENFIKGLSIICDDLSYCCSDFPTFGLEGKDILKEIRAILSTYMPF